MDSHRQRLLRSATRATGVLVLIVLHILVATTSGAGDAGLGKPSFPDEELTFFVVSDTHYGMLVEAEPEAANRANVDRMNNLPGTAYPAGLGGGLVGTPRGVLHCGDTTNTGSVAERNTFTTDYGLTGTEGRLKYPVYETYGNHDGNTETRNFIKSRNPLRPGVTNISSNGLHYSWDWNGVHFICIGVAPGLTYNPYDPAYSLPFLIDDLKLSVGNTGRPVIIYQHFGLDAYGAEWWPETNRVPYKNAIKGYNVLGIFHGHTHNDSIYKWEGFDVYNVPHMNSSGPKHGFCVVRIKDDTMSVGMYYGTGWSTTHTKTFTIEPDPNPPIPDPASFAMDPTAIGPTKMEMRAELGTDSTGVEYYFAELSGSPGASDSGWQEDPYYMDTDLVPSTQYTYTVQMRDFVGQEGGISEPKTATTFPPDLEPPSPNPATFEVLPFAESGTVVSMRASAGTDLSDPLQYYFAETTGNEGSNDSGWRFNSYYSDSGLIPGTQYTYTVKVRDFFGNETLPSDPVDVVTRTDVRRDVTFFVFTDTHYDGAEQKRNYVNLMVDDMNALPGAAYPASIGGFVNTPRGVLSAGDNTNSAKIETEWKDWLESWGLNGEGGRCVYPIFEASGNHDGGPLGTGAVRDQIVIRNQTRKGLTKISSNGLHYSFDWDDVHFVCLNHYAAEVADVWTVAWNNPHYSLSFLVEDLKENVADGGRPIVLYQHYGWDGYSLTWWTPADAERLWNVIQGYNVSTALNGHNSGEGVVVWHGIPTRSMDGDGNGYFVLHIYNNKMYVVHRKKVNGVFVWGTTVTANVVDRPDTDIPSPDPAAFQSPPTAIGPRKIEMTATVGSDASGVVEYYFAESSGNAGGGDSGWTKDPHYVDIGLEPDTEYTYTVRARDFFGKEGGASAPMSATTLPPDPDPPLPDPAVFAEGPEAAGGTMIRMKAEIGSDVSNPVQYYFAETSGNPGGDDSGWREDPEYVDYGLKPETQYAYTVQMRDDEGNMGAVSAPANVLTNPPPEIPVPLVNLEAGSLPLGISTGWENTGSLGGTFSAGASDPEARDIAGMRGVTFDGNDYMRSSFVTTADMTGVGDYTVAVWVHNPDLLDVECVVAWAKRGTTARCAQLNYGKSPDFGAVSHIGDTDMGFAGWIPTAGYWHHIAVTYQGGTNGMENVYADGALNASEKKTLNLWTGDPIFIGAGVEADSSVLLNYLSGSVAVVQIYSQELSADQIAFLAGAYEPPAPPPTNTVGPSSTPTPTSTPKPTLTPGGPPTPTIPNTATPIPGGGNYTWDGGGDGVSWNSPANWLGDLEYPNAPGAGAFGVNAAAINLYPGGTWQNNFVAVGKAQFYGSASIGANVAATATLVFDNGDEPAVLETNATNLMIYVPITIAGDLNINVTGGRCEHHRNLFKSTSPENSVTVTTTNGGVFRFTQEQGFLGGSQADGYVDFGDLIITPGSYVISRNTHWPGRYPLGLGTIRMGNASTLEIQMRAFLPNDFVISGDYVTIKFVEDRVAMGNIEGVISGSARLVVNMEDRADGGTFIIAGDGRNTYSGGTVINGLTADTQFYVLDKNGATGLGDVTLGNFAKIRITDAGSQDDRIDDLASLYLAQGGTSCTVDLSAGVNETIARLFINGQQQVSGTWGSPDSGAANTNSTYFTGSGTLNVTNAPGEPVNTRTPTNTPTETSTAAPIPTPTHDAVGKAHFFFVR